MLSFEVHRQVGDLIRAIYGVTSAARERAAYAEIELRVERARTAQTKLEELTGKSFGPMTRHLAWLNKRHREGSPTLAEGDIDDLLLRDLPEAIETVIAWAEQGLDAELRGAMERSWVAHDYDGAVRAAFIELEQRMRRARANTRSRGKRLATEVFESPRDLRDVDDRTALVGGAFGLFRNEAAHNDVGYSREQAGDIIALINLSLRLVDERSAS